MILTHIVRWLQNAAESYRQDRDWWREAEATYVLCVIAGRAFALCLFVLMLAAGVTVFLSPDQFGGADILLATLLLYALYLLVLSARRMGDALALHVVRDADPGQSAPQWIRMSVLASALVATSGLVWCGYCIAHRQMQELLLVRNPVAFRARVGGLLFLFSYLAVGCARTFALFAAKPPFRESLMKQVYGDSWRGFKNFDRFYS